MALSPLIMQGAAHHSNNLKPSRFSNNAVASNGATPERVNNGTGRDVAEQMNEDEKAKYVKGPPPCSGCSDYILTLPRQETRRRYLCQCLSRSSQVRSLEARRHQEVEDPERIQPDGNANGRSPRIEAPTGVIPPEYHLSTLRLFLEGSKHQPCARIPSSWRSRNVDQGC